MTNKMKRLLTTVVIISVLVAGISGVMLVLDMVSATAVKDALIKTFLVFAIVTVVSALIMGVLHLNKDHS